MMTLLTYHALFMFEFLHFLGPISAFKIRLFSINCEVTNAKESNYSMSLKMAAFKVYFG